MGDSRFDESPNPPPPTLEYRRRSGGAGNVVLAGIVVVLGLAGGLFGAVTLFLGITGVIYCLTTAARADVASDLLESVLFLLIGGVSLIAAVRWC